MSDGPSMTRMGGDDTLCVDCGHPSFAAPAGRCYACAQKANLCMKCRAGEASIDYGLCMWWHGVAVLEGVQGGDFGELRLVTMDALRDRHTSKPQPSKRPAARARLRK